MITPLISLKIILYTPLGVYCEIYHSLEGNIERVKSQYFKFYNDILLNTHFWPSWVSSLGKTELVLESSLVKVRGT